jgi:hypothetical protein
VLGENEAKGSTLPPKQHARVHGHAGVCESAHAHAGVTATTATETATTTRRPGRLTRERKQGRKVSGAARAATTTVVPT